MLPSHRYDDDHKPIRGLGARIKSWARLVSSPCVCGFDKPQSWIAQRRDEDHNLIGCRLILTDRDTRNLFCFLIVNLSFAVVELVYGIWTNSLGLISDSFHMFFDCTALVTGLIASLITRNPANDKYTFGYDDIFSIPSSYGGVVVD